jgi:hypothetical protein
MIATSVIGQLPIALGGSHRSEGERQDLVPVLVGVEGDDAKLDLAVELKFGGIALSEPGLDAHNVIELDEPNPIWLE